MILPASGADESPPQRGVSGDDDAIAVVLIEDSTVFARAVAHALVREPEPRFQVEHFSSLTEGAKHVHAKGADCVLLDLGLPDAQGIEALRLLQASAPEVAVVVLSGVEDERLALQAVQEGAQDYLVKGRADAAVITRSIRYAVERRRAEGERAAFLREKAARAEAEAVTHTVRQLERLTEAALSQLPLDDLLDSLLERVAEMVDADIAAILLLDEERGVLEMRAARGLTPEEIEASVPVPVGRGFAGRIVSERRPIALEDIAVADIVNPELRRATSALGVPLTVERRVIGVLHVASATSRAFGAEESGLLQLAADRAALAIERARVFEQEHETAVTLQRSLLPDTLPEVPHVSLAARYLPGAAGTEVGGDWYDVLELPDGRLGLAMGDVVGRGIRAASLMGQLRNGLRAYALEGHAPKDAVGHLDRLVQVLAPGRMATLLFGTIAPDGRSFTYSNAGHLPPVVVPPGGEAKLHEGARSVPLGVLPYSTIEETTIPLEPGSMLLLCTDGLVELRTESIETRLELLREVAGRGPREDPDAMCDVLLAELLPSGPGSDDVAILVLTTSPEGGDRLAMTLPAEPEALVAARRALRRWLDSVGATADESYDITLAAGEACTNAIEHAYTPGHATFDFEVERVPGSVMVRVRDRGRWRAPRGRNRGRGLTLMDKLMDEVNVNRTDAGTVVELRKRVASA